MSVVERVAGRQLSPHLPWVSPRQGEASSKGSQQMLPDLMSDLLIHTSLRVHERDRGFGKAARTRKA
jgi:hypothetical protein